MGIFDRKYILEQYEAEIAAAKLELDRLPKGTLIRRGIITTSGKVQRSGALQGTRQRYSSWPEEPICCAGWATWSGTMPWLRRISSGLKQRIRKR